MVSMVCHIVIRRDGVYRKEDQSDVDLDLDDEDMEDVQLYDEMERHWRVFLEGQ